VAQRPMPSTTTARALAGFLEPGGQVGLEHAGDVLAIGGLQVAGDGLQREQEGHGLRREVTDGAIGVVEAEVGADKLATRAVLERRADGGDPGHGPALEQCGSV